MESSLQPPWVILKFGGSSVADPNLWPTIEQQCRTRIESGLKPVLVMSALKNVSNLLEALLHQAVAGVHNGAIFHLKELHETFASQLGLDADALLSRWFVSLQDHCEAIAQAGTILPCQHASVLATGELLSSTLGAAYLSGQGMDCHWQDVREILQSKARSEFDDWHEFNSAECDFNRPLTALDSIANPVIVTQGFIAKNASGQTVLLGREGSDTSAAYLGAMLSARSVEIWTDVPGVFSFNPRVIAGALHIQHLDYSQAFNMTEFGAKVLHPRALAPVQAHQIPLWVKSTQQPECPGSLVSAKRFEGESVMAMAVEGEAYRLCVPDTVEFAELIVNVRQLGFDVVFEKNCTDINEHHLVCVFNNSDHAAPEFLSLIPTAQREQSQMLSALCAITLIGPVSSDDWMAAVLAFLEQKEGLPIIQSYPFKGEGRLSLLVAKTDETAVCLALHRKFIECEANRHFFGKSWSELTR